MQKVRIINKDSEHYNKVGISPYTDIASHLYNFEDIEVIFPPSKTFYKFKVNELITEAQNTKLTVDWPFGWEYRNYPKDKIVDYIGSTDNGEVIFKYYHHDTKTEYLTTRRKDGTSATSPSIDIINKVPPPAKTGIVHLLIYKDLSSNTIVPCSSLKKDFIDKIKSSPNIEVIDCKEITWSYR